MIRPTSRPLLAALALACAGTVGIYAGCKGSPPPAPDIVVEIEGHWGSEPALDGSWTPFVVHGSPVVGLVGESGSGAEGPAEDLQLAAWWTPSGETAPRWIGGYPSCPVEACPATVEPRDGWLRFLLDTSLAVEQPPETIRLSVAAWRGDRLDVVEHLAHTLAAGQVPAGAQLPTGVTVLSSPVIVATKNYRFRDASEAVLSCKTALKEKSDDREDLCRDAIEQHRNDGQARNYMLALERLAYHLRRQSRLTESRELFEEAARAAASVEGGLPSDQTRALRMASLVCEEAGDYPSATQLAHVALEIDLEQGHMLWEVRDRSRIGSLASKQGHPTEAIGELRRALELARLLESDYDENNALLTLAEVYEGTGRYSRALACMEDARPAEPYESGTKGYLADTWANYFTASGWLQLKARRRGLLDIPAAEVRGNLSQALAINRELGYELRQANDLMNLAQLDIQLRDPSSARNHLTASRQLLETNGSFEYRSHALALEGELALLEGDAPAALELFGELAEVEGRWSAGWWAHYGQARALADLGRPEQAIEAYEASLSQLEGAAALLDPLVDRPYFTGDRDEVYDQYLLLLLDHGRQDEAFAVSERCRDRTARARKGIVGEEQHLHQALQAKVADVKRRLDLHEQDEAFLRPAARRAWTAEREGLLEELVESQAALAAALRLPAVPDPVDLGTLCAVIPRDGTVLYYHATANELILFVLRRDGPQLFRTGVAQLQLATWIADLQRGLGAGEGPLGQAELVAAVLPGGLSLHAGQPLLVVPHGPLHALPFAVIGRDGHRLVEQHAISYAPGAGILSVQSRPPLDLATAQATVVADPTGDLQGAREEGREVSAVVPGSTLLLGSQATVPSIQQALARDELFHYAGHAVVDADLPQHSHLRLADGQQLTWLDLQTTRVKPSLVVLSGCETGRSLTPAAGEAWGLSTAFLHAGAGSVVAAGWEVPDAPTRVMMERLYEGIGDDNVAESLRQSQLALLGGKAGPEAMDPHIWGAFAHHGLPW